MIYTKYGMLIELLNKRIVLILQVKFFVHSKYINQYRRESKVVLQILPS